MKKNKKKIVVTGGSGRFGKCLKKNITNYNMIFPTKSKLKIEKPNSILNYLKKK